MSCKVFCVTSSVCYSRCISTPHKGMWFCGGSFIKRPSSWALLDIKTGEIVENRTCSEYDFSNESFSNSYSITPDAEYDLSKKYLLSTWKLLDSVRYELIVRKNVNTVIYYDYLARVLNNTPREYQIFYEELSIKGGNYDN